MVKLIEEKIISKGSRKDTVIDYVFENNFPSYQNILEELKEITGYESVEKGTEQWLECTHQMTKVTATTVTMRFIKPYCG